MKETFRYYGTLLGLWCVFGLIPAGVALWIGATQLQASITFWIVGLLVIIPIDRRIDATWRGTVPLSGKKMDHA